MLHVGKEQTLSTCYSHGHPILANENASISSHVMQVSQMYFLTGLRLRRRLE
jgi:hypothetical protein